MRSSRTASRRGGELYAAILEVLIERLAGLGGLDVALTTNGAAAPEAEALVAAGLQRVTVSLGSPRTRRSGP